MYVIRAKLWSTLYGYRSLLKTIFKPTNLRPILRLIETLSDDDTEPGSTVPESISSTDKDLYSNIVRELCLQATEIYEVMLFQEKQGKVECPPQSSSALLGSPQNSPLMSSCSTPGSLCSPSLKTIPSSLRERSRSPLGHSTGLAQPQQDITAPSPVTLTQAPHRIRSKISLSGPMDHPLQGIIMSSPPAMQPVPLVNGVLSKDPLPPKLYRVDGFGKVRPEATPPYQPPPGVLIRDQPTYTASVPGKSPTELASVPVDHTQRPPSEIYCYTHPLNLARPLLRPSLLHSVTHHQDHHQGFYPPPVCQKSTS